MGTLIQILRVLGRQEKIRLALLAGLIFINTLVQVFGLGLVPQFLTLLQAPSGQNLESPAIGWLISILGKVDDSDVRWYFAGLLGVVLLTGSLLHMGTLYYRTIFLRDLMISIGTQLYESYLYTPYEKHVRNNSSDALRNLTNEIRRFKSVVMGGLEIVINGLLVLGLIVLLAYATPGNALLALCIPFIGAILFLLLTRRKAQRVGRVIREQYGKVIESSMDGLGVLPLIRIKSQEPFFLGRFNDALSAFAYAEQFQKIMAQITRPMLEVFTFVALGTLGVVLVWGGVPIPEMIAIAGLYGATMIRLVPYTSSLLSAMTMIRVNASSVTPIHDKLYEPLEPIVKPIKNGQSLDRFESLEVRNLSYRFPSEAEDALRGLSLTVHAGESIAFVGSTGSGKSTLINLVLGFLKPRVGEIVANGRNIHEDLASWRQHLAYIPQTNFLLDDSIRHNIALGVADRDIDEEKLWRVLSMAQLENTVRNMREGLDTIVGEDGSLLSGGQRQRIGIARALYNDADVLIMDEATAALDNATEQALVDSIEVLRGKLTVILVAHRMSTVRNCDRIYYMEDGQILASDTYDRLKELSEGFRKIAE